MKSVLFPYLPAVLLLLFSGSCIFIWMKTEDSSAADEAAANLTFTTLADFIH